MKPIVVVTTVASAEEARGIAAALVERKLAACVQISAIESVYTWRGETQHDTEYRVMVKTLADRYGAVEEAIRELHSYDLPAIYALEIGEIFAPYADWVAENSSGVANG